MKTRADLFYIIVGYRRFFVLITISVAVLGAILFGLWRLASICPGHGFCPGVFKHKAAPKQAQISGSSATSDDLRHATSQSPSSAPAPQQFSGMAPVPTALSTKDPCEGFPDTSNILLAVAGYHVQDSLEEVREEVKLNNPDFDLYFRQKNCASDQETCNRNTNDNTAAQGWSLDKYKNIHIAEKTWKQKLNYDWYLYVDADTYVVWPTIVGWLQYVNPKEQWCVGSVAFLGDFPFAHGSSGCLLSQVTMRRFFDGK
ncbi:unnamed protein product [Clonostachys rosea]|uniref:Hexosyltransferase n=1 Tax=Bionectria ochroleuca TaxID=29856 RepID=A0ABY6TVU7_BIOOC|nr:unnamed protein product [Clonostachys rosea]